MTECWAISMCINKSLSQIAFHKYTHTHTHELNTTATQRTEFSIFVSMVIRPTPGVSTRLYLFNYDKNSFQLMHEFTQCMYSWTCTLMASQLIGGLFSALRWQICELLTKTTGRKCSMKHRVRLLLQPCVEWNTRTSHRDLVWIWNCVKWYRSNDYRLYVVCCN